MANYDNWEPTQSDLDVREQSGIMHAERCGLDVMDPNVLSFIQHTAKVMATMDSELRFVRNSLHPENQG